MSTIGEDIQSFGGLDNLMKRLIPLVPDSALVGKRTKLKNMKCHHKCGTITPGT